MSRNSWIVPTDLKAKPPINWMREAGLMFNPALAALAVLSRLITSCSRSLNHLDAALGLRRAAACTLDEVVNLFLMTLRDL